MKALVTFAVDTELAPWRRRHNFRRVAGADYPLYEGQIGDTAVRAVLTGIGPGHATRVMPAVLRDRPDICVSSGFAGALRPEYRAGEILAARAVSVAGDAVLSCEESLLALALRCGARPVELFRTSETLVRTTLENLRMSLEADAAEMESYAVLAEAARWGVPAVAIRAISDLAAEELPYELDRARGRDGRVRWSGLLAQVARHPGRLPALVRLGRRCRRAAASLAQFLDQFVGAAHSWMSLAELSCDVAAT
jgi:adenosylhomocysteine nucleosidase